MKVIQNACSLLFLVAFVTAQSSTKSRKSSDRDEPVGQGRTFGAIGSLFGLGSGSGFGSGLGVGSGLTSLLGFDAPIAPYRPLVRPGVRPQSPQADPFYGGYGGYGGYPSNNYYGGYRYRPNYGFNGYGQQFGGYPGLTYGYRPQPYPENYGGYGGYPSNNYQRPEYGGHSPQAPTYFPAGSGISSGLGASTPGSPGSNIRPEQAAQVANLLGQLLGSQLRPLLSGAGSVGRSGRVRDVAPRYLVR